MQKIIDLRTDPTIFGGAKCRQTGKEDSVYSLHWLLDEDEEFTVTYSVGKFPHLVTRNEWEEIEKGDIATCARGQYRVVDVVPCHTGMNLVFVVPTDAEFRKPEC